MANTKLSLDEVKRFFTNLATALLPGSKFALWVESTSQKNKFTAVLLPEGYGEPKGLNVIEPIYWSIKPSWDDFFQINGLDSVLKAACPQLMFRPRQAVELDQIAEALNVDANAIYQHVLKAIRNHVSKALKWKYDHDDGTFYIATYKARYFREPTSKTNSFKTIEELYVWADLHAN